MRDRLFIEPCPICKGTGYTERKDPKYGLIRESCNESGPERCRLFMKMPPGRPHLTLLEARKR